MYAKNQISLESCYDGAFSGTAVVLATLAAFFPAKMPDSMAPFKVAVAM